MDYGSLRPHWITGKSELFAIYKGLTMGGERGFVATNCYSNSLEAIRLIKTHNDNHHLTSLVSVIRDEIDKLENFNLVHTWREGNSVARPAS